MANFEDKKGFSEKNGVSDAGVSYGGTKEGNSFAGFETAVNSHSVESANRVWNSQAKGPKEWRPEIVD